MRKPKLFFVSTSATTTTLQTGSICYVSTAAYATCSGRKRRAITAFSEMETEVQPKQDEVDSSLQEAESGGRDGRFLLYWITTTSISTSTSYTLTYSVSAVTCTPPGGKTVDSLMSLYVILCICLSDIYFMLSGGNIGS